MKRLNRKHKLMRRAFHKMANHNLKMFGLPPNTQSITPAQLVQYWPHNDCSFIDGLPDGIPLRIHHFCDGIMMIDNGQTGPADWDLVGYFDKNITPTGRYNEPSKR